MLGVNALLFITSMLEKISPRTLIGAGLLLAIAGLAVLAADRRQPQQRDAPNNICRPDYRRRNLYQIADAVRNRTLGRAGSHRHRADLR